MYEIFICIKGCVELFQLGVGLEFEEPINE
jgi:hypothetical protein